MYKVGIIGMGRIGNNIADLISGCAEVLPVRKPKKGDADSGLTSAVDFNPDFASMINSNPDCVVFCASEFPAEVRQRTRDRNAEWEANQHLVKNYLFHFPRDYKGLVVVVTNPTYFIASRFVYVGINAYGFGLDVDASRMSQYFGQPIKVIGQHGNAFPVLNLDGNINSLNACILRCQDYVHSDSMIQVGVSGAPPLDVAQNLTGLIKTLANGKEGIFHLEHPHHPYFGGPCKVSSQGIMPLDIKLTPAEEKVFDLRCRK